ncbi:MAG TPA: hypothetical protein VN256_08105 [Pyrinomonadaceae bacterium]|nr:hypothetical protein [Pyrinomonadaceae bacterium]
MQETIDVKIRALVAGLKEVQKLQGELKGIERAAGKKLSVNVTGRDRALGLFRELSSTGDGLIDRFQRIEKASGASFGGMAAGAGIAAGGVMAAGAAVQFVVEKINEAVQAAVELGSRFNDLSIASGLSVETLSGLENQLRQSNSSVEDLSDGVFFLQKNLGSAAAGNKELRQTFAQMGITDFDAALADMDGTLRKVLKSLSSIDDEGKRNVVGAEVMGRAYKNLRVFVEDLGGEVDETIEAARKMNLVMSGEAAAAADRLGDRMDMLRLRIERARVELGGRFVETTQNSMALIETLLDENAGAWDRWGDGLSGSILRVWNFMTGLTGAVRLFTLGVPQERIDAARRADTAAAIKQSAKGAQGRRGDNDFDLAGPGKGGGGGGGGGKRKRPDVDTLDAQLSLTRAQIESGFNLTKDLLERENKLYETKLADRLITIKDFYGERERIETQAIDAELIKLEQLMGQEKLRFENALKKIGEDKELSKKERKAKEENELNKHLQENVRLQEQITILGEKRKALPDEIARREREATDALKKHIREIENELLEAQGRTFDAEAGRIKATFQDDLLGALANTGQGLTAPIQQVIADVKELGGVTAADFDEILKGAGLRFEDMSEEVQRIIKLVEILLGKAQNTELLSDLDKQFEEHYARIDKIQSRRVGNYIEELRVREQINDENIRAIELLEKEVKELEIRAALTKNPELLIEIRKRRQAIEQMKNELIDFKRELKDLAINSVVDGLTDLFVNIGRDATNAKEYVRDFFVTLIEEVNRAIIRMLVLKAVMAALNIIGGGGGGFGSPDELFAAGGFARGGFVSEGPEDNAAGNMHAATPGGRLIRVAEAGYDEVVLTTDPKYRGRTERLLARFLSLTGFAPAFGRGGFALNERLLASVTSSVPALAAGDFISNLPGPRPSRGDSGTNRPAVTVNIRPDAQGRVRSKSQISVDYLRAAEEGRRNT